MSALIDAQLAVFALLFFPSLYCLFRHGKTGILGWFYVNLFCALRVIGCALTIRDEHNGTVGTAATIIMSVGLSPLLLSAAGILGEARRSRSGKATRGLEWFLVIQFHLIVAVGIALIASRGSSLVSGQFTSTDKALIYAGLAIIDFAWILLCCWALFSLRMRSRREISNAVHQAGTMLLISVFASLPLICLRLVYATIYFTVHSSTVKTSLALKVCISVAPEMLVIALFVVVGVLTRNLNEERNRIAQPHTVESFRPK
ncbi:hypothetical protein L228DRAFT_281412 [Xylona heveae TC161]|uniref:DUF7702 domain-containing protein n=1 Tax=Xylona heveae (strain CBS 132557 / TC161) TaxID=1328760 RepID=A0A161TEG3_XYLHT|nr:hypothetical protein L228DRAFT_281412 [Xylona heveae TC161]KZF24327.1 hypothetical protein L228DRAFT_281412 [Xylona heveae TC161]